MRVLADVLCHVQFYILIVIVLTMMGKLGFYRFSFREVMMFDDEPVKKETAHVVGVDLTTFSIEEIDKRIEQLKAEILRLEEASNAKRATMASAESFFKN